MDKKKFGQIERTYTTESALNIFMVQRKIRPAFFDGAEFETQKDMEKYKKKYERMINSFGLKVKFFERAGDYEYILDCLVYNSSVSKNVEKQKSMLDHKKVGNVLGFPCPRNLDDKQKRDFFYELQFHKKTAYVDDWMGGIEKYKPEHREWLQIFAYNCGKSSEKYMEDMILKGETLKRALLAIKIDNIRINVVQRYYC